MAPVTIERKCLTSNLSGQDAAGGVSGGAATRRAATLSTRSEVGGMKSIFFGLLLGAIGYLVWHVIHELLIGALLWSDFRVEGVVLSLRLSNVLGLAVSGIAGGMAAGRRGMLAGIGVAVAVAGMAALPVVLAAAAGESDLATGSHEELVMLWMLPLAALGGAAFAAHQGVKHGSSLS